MQIVLNFCNTFSLVSEKFKVSNSVTTPTPTPTPTPFPLHIFLDSLLHCIPILILILEILMFFGF
jgi:hypothetical protein